MGSVHCGIPESLTTSTLYYSLLITAQTASNYYWLDKTQGGPTDSTLGKLCSLLSVYQVTSGRVGNKLLTELSTEAILDILVESCRCRLISVSYLAF